MKLGTRFFFCFIIIFTIGFYYPIDWVLNSLRTLYLESVEEPLVDQANILAAWVGIEIESGRFDITTLHRAFDAAYKRRIAARVYQLKKTNVDQCVYITDRTGKVLFDSQHRKREGSNYSHWRDVSLTLKGSYGARTTRRDPNDLTSSVLYVAAPIIVDQQIAGVLTVGKPTTNINRFIKGAKPQIIKIGTISLMVVILLSCVIVFWLTRPIKRLTRYANDIRDGKRDVAPPPLDSSEIGEMGSAFQEMKEALEGKKYIENYVQTLTHEIKSPLSAITGAAELLEENMLPEKQARFLANIRSEIGRIRRLVDRMLALASLENQKKLHQLKIIALKKTVDTILEELFPLISQKHLSVLNHIPGDTISRADSFLLKQALSNLILNAIEFCASQGQIEIEVRSEEHIQHIRIRDNGSGIPEFAMDRLFEKFFSLQRPESGKKSTGLGLNFVREVADLHHGMIVIENRRSGGVAATLSLPLP